MSEANSPSRRDQLVSSLQALLSNDSLDLDLFQSGGPWPEINIATQSQQGRAIFPVTPPSSCVLLPTPREDSTSNPILSDSTNILDLDHLMTSDTVMIDPALMLDIYPPFEAEVNHNLFHEHAFPTWLQELEDSMALEATQNFHQNSTKSLDDQHPFTYSTPPSPPAFSTFPEPTSSHVDVDNIFDSLITMTKSTNEVSRQRRVIGTLQDHCSEVDLFTKQTLRDSRMIDTTGNITLPANASIESAASEANIEAKSRPQNPDTVSQTPVQPQFQRFTPSSGKGTNSAPNIPRTPKQKSQRAHYVIEKKYRAGLYERFEALRACVAKWKKTRSPGQQQQQSSGSSVTTASDEKGEDGAQNTVVTGVGANAAASGSAPTAQGTMKMNKAEVLSEAVTCIDQLREENEVLLDHVKLLVQRIRAAKIAFQ